jgi:hypothetical protein
MKNKYEILINNNIKNVETNKNILDFISKSIEHIVDNIYIITDLHRNKFIISIENDVYKILYDNVYSIENIVIRDEKYYLLQYDNLFVIRDLHLRDIYLGSMECMFNECKINRNIFINENFTAFLNMKNKLLLLCAYRDKNIIRMDKITNIVSYHFDNKKNTLVVQANNCLYSIYDNKFCKLHIAPNSSIIYHNNNAVEVTTIQYLQNMKYDIVDEIKPSNQCK